MAAPTDDKPLGRAPKQVPPYWGQSSSTGSVAHQLVPVTDQEKQWLQEMLTNTYKNKSTRDRRGGPLADSFTVVSALRSEHPALWEKFADRRKEVARLQK